MSVSEFVIALFQIFLIMKTTVRVFIVVFIGTILMIFFKDTTGQKLEKESVDEIITSLPKTSQEYVYTFFRNDDRLNVKLALGKAIQPK